MKTVITKGDEDGFFVDCEGDGLVIHFGDQFSLHFSQRIEAEVMAKLILRRCGHTTDCELLSPALKRKIEKVGK